MIIASIGLGELLWSLVVVFFMIQYFILLFNVIVDVFRSNDLSGGMKAVWAACLFFFPFITLLVYLIVRGTGMAQRSVNETQRAQADFEQYVRSVGAAPSPADQIAQAKALLDAGTIDQADFDVLKTKALS